MINYPIGKAIEIISSCDESFAIDTKHFDVRNIQRIWDFGLIFETFLNNPLMGIIKQDFNNIKIIYNEKYIMIQHIMKN